MKCFPQSRDWMSSKLLSNLCLIEKSHSRFKLRLTQHIGNPPRLAISYFDFSRIFLVFCMHIFNLLESNVMVYQARKLWKTFNICQSLRYNFGYLLLSDLWVLVWDSRGYMYWRGNINKWIKIWLSGEWCHSNSWM